MSLPGFEWLRTLCEDGDHVRAGFQASWLYVAWNVFVPAAFGAVLAVVLKLLRKTSDG